jgi:transposase-like protein
MEVIMNIEVVELIAKANKIISVTGNGAGAKYPKSLKKIIVSLRVDHKLSVKEIVKHIPVSSYSAREWPRQFLEKQTFNKVTIQEVKPERVKKRIPKRNKQMDLIIFNQRVLLVLITLLIFEPLAFRLFY